MIQAERAERIMQLYESDYDDFLGKLKTKLQQKKAEAKTKKAEANKKKSEADKTKSEVDKASKTVSEAEAHKKVHLAEKAKDLIDKNGGISGIASSVQNVVNFIKGTPTEPPADYQVDVGKKDEKADDTILGMPSMVVYVGGSVVVLLGLYGLYRIANKPPVQNNAMQQAPMRMAD